MRGRLLPLGVAMTMAGIAVVSVYLYVHRVEEEAVEGLQTRNVLVATRFLPAGATAADILEAGAFEVKEVPERYLSPQAFSGPEQLAPSLTLVDDVAAGEQLTASRFGSGEENPFLAQLPEGAEALSLPLEHVRGVAGHLAAGDRINAYVTVDGRKGANRVLKKLGIDAHSATVFDPTKSISLLLLENLLVVEVASGQLQADGTPAAGPSSMSLAVTSEEAVLLIQAQERAKLWFTLAPAEEV